MSESRTVLNLNGIWNYKQDADDEGGRSSFFSASCDRSDWKKMDIPHNWYLTEVGDYDGIVWFQREFTVDEAYLDTTLDLHFKGVDYIAEVWLNGEYLGAHEGYFNPFSFDVSGKVKRENLLVVKVNSPRDPTEYIRVGGWQSENPLSEPYERHWAKDLTIIKGHLIDAMHRPGAMTKFRQDGNTGGIWQDVELISRGPVKLEYCKIYSEIVEENFKPDGTALVSVDVEVLNTGNTVTQAELQLTITPENFEEDLTLTRHRTVELQPGLNLFKLIKTIPDVKLWWTWDYGKPNLYRYEVKVLHNGQASDCLSEPFSVKSVVHNEADGSWSLNGKKIFIRGMRYFSSMYMSEITEERVRRDLDKMLDFDINSIRIGSHVEKKFFYEICDRMGYLVWQVFPMHYCYSDSDELIERASVMIRDMMRMLHNHACIGMWSVFKEPKVYQLDNVPNNYGRLCHILYETAHTVDPVRWIHKGDYEEGVQNLMLGCCAPGETDLTKMKIEPNIVEFGSASLPVLKSLKKIIPEKDLWPPNWDTYEYWGFFYNLMFYWGKCEMGDSIEEFIENTQYREAKMVKEQIEFLRQRKYSPVASMYLYYWSDAAPVIGSGLLDYYEEKYMVYDYMKAVYTKVLVSLQWNRDPYYIGFDKFWKPGESLVCKIWATNDVPEDIEGVTIHWNLVRKSDGQLLLEESVPDKVLAADSSESVGTLVWDIPGDAQPGDYNVFMKITDSSHRVLSENYFDFIVG